MTDYFSEHVNHFDNRISNLPARERKKYPDKTVEFFLHFPFSPIFFVSRNEEDTAYIKSYPTAYTPLNT